MEKKEIYEVPIRTIKYLFYQWKKDRPVARSLFLSKNDYGTYIAIDNTCCGFAINEFNSFDEALFWLCSKKIAPDDVYKLDKTVIRSFIDNCDYKINQINWVKNGLSFGC